ncbi:UDP-N-acetylglucosamine--N-acetylmuramyl-(pentapeptide) pyrophosphoryl-undecaprenol N-acetylglucosamine transferase [Fontivita pretiosa]|uniref:UDP-N-acetylglucosamine--N-acetylmuramyl- (pentapeptide) pyrophosphoryl-undecaprenol N-acetylglucosamine transferase n=1 Tax=Fontivita pretiosa TaxID=2989684 RepID=UPI003D180E9A
MSETSKSIFLAGGGTGGHLYPGIAVAEALREVAPELKPIFLCTQREIDRTILSSTGFEFIAQPIVPPTRTVGGLLKFWKSWRETKDLVKTAFAEHKPLAILGLGGYAAGVAVKYAATRGLPAVILNPDVVPGRANQYLLRSVQAMCCQFEATKHYVPVAQQSKLRITGCPIRRDIIHLPPREQALARLGLARRVMTLVITGASQGALTVNQAFLGCVASLNLQGWQILHLAGKEHAESVRREYRELGIEAAVIDFTPAMADVWAVADLAISRAGASTCAELTACGVPSILMPYPYHKDQQQKLNARVLAEAGAAVLLEDQKDRKKNAERLGPILQSLLYDAPRRALMSQAARALGKPNAAAAVAAVIMEMIRQSR